MDTQSHDGVKKQIELERRGDLIYRINCSLASIGLITMIFGDSRATSMGIFLFIAGLNAFSLFDERRRLSAAVLRDFEVK